MPGLRLAFLGTPDVAARILRTLAASPHRIAAVYSQPARPAGRGHKEAPAPVARVAAELGLPLFTPARLGPDEASAFAALALDAAIVAAYGLILPKAMVEAPRLGSLNVHASLLPRWRGAAPVQRAILAGDSVTGVTIMSMDEGLDTGPILLTREIAIGSDDTAGSLAATLAGLGAEALLAALAGLAAGTLAAHRQPGVGITYAAKIAKSEASIDWSRDAALIERQVRAFNPWPVAETTLGGERLRIHSAKVSAANESLKETKSLENGDIVLVRDGIMLVKCGQGLLEVRRVQKPGGRVLAVSEFAHNLDLAGRRLG